MFHRTKTYQEANLPHKTIENKNGLGVSQQFLLISFDLPSAIDRVTAMFSYLCFWQPVHYACMAAFTYPSSDLKPVTLKNTGGKILCK